MDIAKIRKKAREREKETAGNPPPQPPEVKGRGKDEAHAGVPAEAELNVSPAGGITRVTDFAGDTSAAAGIETFAAAMVEEAERSEKEEVSSPEDAEVQEEIVELLTFSLAKEEFAFRVSEVEEIIRHQRITAVPSMPDYVLGITSLRGKIIPVIDLRRRIVLRGAHGDAETPAQDALAGNTKVVILLGPKGPIGATIDRVIGVVRLPRSRVLEPPAHLLEEERRFVDGVVVLDRRFVSIVRSEEALNIEVT